ncbi:unnamed protein product [Owenia fusiformis]|uniref:Uncharacterized protein n=1 Tax=Owenia fusiformis TaxID=6347 RepID=A0A8J1TGW6_OWEFU|nr:unnamed protein product [Owenia fusiformis]
MDIKDIKTMINDPPIDSDSDISSHDSAEDEEKVAQELRNLRRIERKCRKNKVKAMKAEISRVRESIDTLETETENLSDRNKTRTRTKLRQKPSEPTSSKGDNNNNTMYKFKQTGDYKSQGAIPKIDTKTETTSNFNANDLRSNKGLQKRAESKIPTIFDSSSDYSTTSSQSSTSDTEQRDSHKRRGKKHLKSGATKKSTDIVKKQLKWPHSGLKIKFARKYKATSDLDFPLFVAGETNIIISKNISASERQGRLNLLSKVAYAYNMKYKWAEIRDFHADVLHSIERGHIGWDDEVQILALRDENLTTPITSSVSTSASSNKSSSESKSLENTYFCRFFSRGECKIKEKNHMGFVNNKSVNVKHICAKCWLHDKKEKEHSEIDKVCPYLVGESA